MQLSKKILEQKKLPESYSVVAHKALANMQIEYGDELGTEIFLRRAVERGKGKTLSDQISSTYKKGGKLSKKPLRSSKPIVQIANKIVNDKRVYV